MFEKAGQDDLTPAVRQPVGIQRDRNAADDREQPKADPRGHQPGEPRPCGGHPLGLRSGQRIDDPPEQHRLRKRGSGERQVGQGKIDPETPLRTQQGQRPRVDAP